MKSGVSQDFILGPTLFLLFINDLPHFMNYCYLDFFADDATLHTHDNKPDKVEEKLQCGADHNAKDWSRQNNLHINYDKTNYMILGRTNKQNVSHEFHIRVDDNWLPIVNRLKYNKAVFTYKVMNNLTPQYITDLLKPVAVPLNRTLRSSVNDALAVPRSRSY